MENKIAQEVRIKRMEQIREFLTVVFVVMGLIIIQLPLPGSFNPEPVQFNKTGIYSVAVFLLIFTFSWHRLLPKKFVGQFKFFIETLVYLLGVSLVISYTGGVYSYFSFFYFLPLLNIAANLSLSFTVLSASIASFFLLLQITPYFGRNDLPNVISIASLNIFGVWLVTVLGRFLASEVSLIHKREESLQVEQLREIDKLKDEFVFIIAHELRSPITAIRGYLELITTDPKNNPDPTLNSLLQRAFVVSNRLANLIGLLLEVARLETGKIRFYLQKIDLRDSVDVVVTELKRDFDQKQINLTIDVPKENIILFDKERLEEILTILLENAIKYTPEYGRISLLSQITGKEILLSIADSGVGIPEDIKSKLYEKFYSEDSESGETVVKGYGVGLYVTKQLLVHMNGDISCESVLGRGTTFTLHLPKYWNFGAA